MIDPTARIHPGAELAENVTVGPYAVIDDNVSIGPNTRIGAHTVVRGNTKIGADNRIYQFSSIGEDPQFAGYRGEETYLEIGDRNVIREYVTLNRGSPAGTGTTRLGNDNFIMAYVHIAHDCELGNHTVFANCASLAGHVPVGDYAILGGFSLVHQFCRIGAHSITGIGSVCLKDIPPYMVAAGNTARPFGINVKGLRRRQFSEEVIRDLRRAYRRLYRAGLELNAAVTEIRRDFSEYAELRMLADFLEGTSRGIIR